ncbi:MAG TPA: alpha/beta fold hydrolase [Drouetiella sp.]
MSFNIGRSIAAIIFSSVSIASFSLRCSAEEATTVDATPAVVTAGQTATETSTAPTDVVTDKDQGSSPTASIASEWNEAKQKANSAFWSRDYKTAKAEVNKILEDAKLDANAKARCLVNRAICESQLDEWEEAKTDSAEAFRLAPEKSLTFADACAIQARVLLMDGKIDKAREMYLRGLSYPISQETQWGPDLAPVYEGLAACHLLEKKYELAEGYYKNVAQLDLLKYGPDDTHVAWALMSLAGVERKLGKIELADKLYKKVFWNFRHQNELRIIEENKSAPNQEEMIATLRRHLYGTHGAYNNREIGLDFLKADIPEKVLNAPPNLREKTFDNWFKERIGREKAPGLAFFNPLVPLKGLIVTVHGLGLYSGAYTAFGERIQKEGFGVVSFDVRGFGSYRNDEVTQKLDLHLAITDMQRILTEMRADYPDVPIVLLGESMGGAIVLRIASESPKLVDAVISSVPSGSRYQSHKTAFKVALKFLNNKHGQFDVGKGVVEQATVDADLRDMWEGDSQMRMKLSPAELVNFQNFMGENIKAAGKITKTPVIIFQGFSDNLVKPMGTLAIYQAIPTKDKDMIFIGRAEHLIFEEGQFDEVIFRGVLEWITRHSKRSA